MIIPPNSSRDRALQVIQSGLESGSIKLNGAIANTKQSADDDVIYLSTLLAGLVKAIEGNAPAR